MKLAVSRRHRRNAVLLAAAFGLALASAGAAQAFTFSDQNGNGGAGSGSMFYDRDGKTPSNDASAARFGNGNATIQQGNGSLRFGGNGGGSFNQRYNPNNLFDPYARDGR